MKVTLAFLATSTYCFSVSKSSIEGFCAWIEQVFNVVQTFNFKLFWLLLNDLPEIKRKDISYNMAFLQFFF